MALGRGRLFQPHWALMLGLLLAQAAPVRAAVPAEGKLQRVTVQLNWKHQFQFAGFYAAIEQGYYREAGLEVRLVEAEGDKDPIAAVLSGGADFGVGASELALRRARGEPVVALATILQHSPLVLLARGPSIDTLQALAGQRVMIMPHETELHAFLQREGLSLERIQAVRHSFDPRDLISGKVDAISGYTTDEPFQLQRAGFAYVTLSPRTSGVDFYADTLFTSEDRVTQDRARVSAFLAATLKGWRWAMEQPEQTADLIIARYSTRHSREHLLFEAAEMRRLMQPELLPIGYMNPGRWQHVAEVYAELGMLKAPYSLDGFLFDPDPRPDLAWIYRALGAAALALALVALMALQKARTARRLTTEIAKRIAVEDELRAANAGMSEQLQRIQALQRQLEELAVTDSLTGLYNRRFLDRSLERELARARREALPLSVVLLDIDHFKRLNDTHGHQAGDQVLRALAGLLSSQVRTSDLACRWGGEEFVLVLPGMHIEAASQRAERCRSAFEAMSFQLGDQQVTSTVSAGVACHPLDGGTAEQLLSSADAALYRAKSLGRNRVQLASSPMIA